MREKKEPTQQNLREMSTLANRPRALSDSVKSKPPEMSGLHACSKQRVLHQTEHQYNAGAMVGRRRRRQAIIKPTFAYFY